MKDIIKVIFSGAKLVIPIGLVVFGITALFGVAATMSVILFLLICLMVGLAVESSK